MREDDGTRPHELGFLTTRQAVEEYGTSETSLRRLRELGALTVRTPNGLAKPVYYRRAELDAVFFGVDDARGAAR